jgi:NADPH2:quinone reductase
MNPVDTKVRPATGAEPKVLGFDAAATVVAVGDKTKLLKVGDKVYYAGDITRPGTNAQFHLVDERIAAVRPGSLDAAASAALPLTSLTAWESLFERLGIDPAGTQKGQSLLIIGGAGGVGSIGIQLAKLAGLTVIATASRSESEQWCRDLGADHVINHREDLAPQLAALGFETVDYIANYNNTDAYWKTMGQVIAPQGRIVLIVEQTGDLEIGGPFKFKSVSISWELMFTRSMFQTPDMAKQHEILKRIAALIDSGQIRTTANGTLGTITAKNIIKAHTLIESGRSIGKLVLEGWPA